MIVQIDNQIPREIKTLVIFIGTSSYTVEVTAQQKLKIIKQSDTDSTIKEVPTFSNYRNEKTFS